MRNYIDCTVRTQKTALTFSHFMSTFHKHFSYILVILKYGYIIDDLIYYNIHVIHVTIIHDCKLCGIRVYDFKLVRK